MARAKAAMRTSFMAAPGSADVSASYAGTDEIRAQLFAAVTGM